MKVDFKCKSEHLLFQMETLLLHFLYFCFFFLISWVLFAFLSGDQHKIREVMERDKAWMKKRERERAFDDGRRWGVKKRNLLDDERHASRLCKSKLTVMSFWRRREWNRHEKEMQMTFLCISLTSTWCPACFAGVTQKVFHEVFHFGPWSLASSSSSSVSSSSSSGFAVCVVSLLFSTSSSSSWLWRAQRMTN